MKVAFLMRNCFELCVLEVTQTFLKLLWIMSRLGFTQDFLETCCFELCVSVVTPNGLETALIYVS